MATILEYATPRQSLWKRIRLLVVVFVVVQVAGIVAGGFVGELLAPRPIFCTSGLLAMNGSNVSTVSSVIAQQQACVATMANPAFLAAVSARTGVPALTISANSHVSSVAGSELVRIWYTSPNPREASSVVGAMMASYLAQPCAKSSGAFSFNGPGIPAIVPKSATALLGAVGGWLMGICGCALYAIVFRRNRLAA